MTDIEKIRAEIMASKRVSQSQDSADTVLSRDLWEKTFDAIPDLLAVISLDNRIVRVNKAMAQSLKVTPDDCIGLRCYEAVHGATQPPPACPMANLCTDGKRHTAEIYEPRLGGYFLVTVTPITTPEGKVIGCLHIARDINSTKQYEKSLQDARNILEVRVAERTSELAKAVTVLEKEVLERKKAVERFTKLFTDSPIGMAILNIDFAFTSINPAFCSMLEYTEHELLWRSFKEITHPDHIEENIQGVKSLLAGEADLYKTEKSYLSKSGKRVWASVTVSAVRNERREFLYYLAMAEDITDRKEAEENARLLDEQLVHASKLVALGTLVSSVAHEINNPNQFIMLNTPVLEGLIKKALPLLDREMQENGDFMVGQMQYSELREMVPNLTGGIRKGSQRIKKIVEDLRHFVREESAGHGEEIDVVKVAESAISLMGNMLRKSTMHFVLTNKTKSVRLIKGSAQRIEQVIINLLQNSCQALQDRSKTIELTIDFDEASSSAILTVRDEGCGMSAETMERIRQPFFTTRPEAGGTGLGLSISDRIVKEHGGRMEFESNQGKGTTVKVVLPARGERTPE